MEQDVSQQILGRLDKVDGRLDKLEQDLGGRLDKVDDRLDKGDDRLDKLSDMVEQLALLGHGTWQKLDKLTDKVDELADNVERQRHILVRMEQELGQKVNAALDGHAGNREALTEHNARIVKLETTTEKLTWDVASMKKAQAAD